MELGEYLIREGLISPAQLQEALAEQTRTRERLGEILRRLDLITESDLLDALAFQLGIGRFDPTQHVVEPEALELVPLEFARRHRVLPVRIEDNHLVVAMTDPTDVEARDNLRRTARRAGHDLKVLLVAPEVLEKHRDKYYGKVQGSRDVSALIDKVVDEVGVLPDIEGDFDAESAQKHAEDAGIIKLVDQIVVQAMQERATDIHIEPQEEGLVIRYRVDGMLYDALTPPRAVYTGLVSRIKILSNMDIAERRATQDGRFSHRSKGQEVDIRVSVVPTIHGEKMVLRLLDKTNFSFSLTDLGFSGEDYKAFHEAIRKPYGMILLSGPTGSGKTTTLYANILELNSDVLNITTIEDPVEYQIGRINQVQVNERKQVTFANALRSFLRQDPDVIMVGEIRDQDTADIAVRAALTGHMVFSTIHANDAPTTAARLVGMGTEPFMAASALTLVAAQRLVRKCCPHCLEEYEPDPEVLLAVKADKWLDENGEPVKFRHGAGCVACKGRGFLGRIAIIERMNMTPELRQLVAENKPADVIRRQARSEGMKTLLQSGMEKVRAGTTTAEEVLRVCLSDE